MSPAGFWTTDRQHSSMLASKADKNYIKFKKCGGIRLCNEKTLGKNTEKHLTVIIGKSLKLINLLLLEFKKKMEGHNGFFPRSPHLGLVSSHNLIKYCPLGNKRDSYLPKKNTEKCLPQILYAGWWATLCRGRKAA